MTYPTSVQCPEAIAVYLIPPHDIPDISHSQSILSEAAIITGCGSRQIKNIEGDGHFDLQQGLFREIWFMIKHGLES